jgi:hypothetical protein
MSSSKWSISPTDGSPEQTIPFPEVSPSTQKIRARRLWKSPKLVIESNPTGPSKHPDHTSETQVLYSFGPAS